MTIIISATIGGKFAYKMNNVIQGIKNENTKLLKIKNDLQTTKNNLLGLDMGDHADDILEFGKLNSELEKNNISPLFFINILSRILYESDTYINSLNWKIVSFQPKPNANGNVKYKMDFEIEIYDKNKDKEGLIKKYDKIASKAIRIFSVVANVKYSKINEEKIKDKIILNLSISNK